MYADQTLNVDITSIIKLFLSAIFIVNELNADKHGMMACSLMKNVQLN